MSNQELVRRRHQGPHFLIVQIGEMRFIDEATAPLLPILGEPGPRRLGRANLDSGTRPEIDLSPHLRCLQEVSERLRIIQPTQAWVENRDHDGVWLRTGNEDSRSMFTRPSGQPRTTPLPKNCAWFRLEPRMLIYIGSPHNGDPFIMLRFIP